MKGFKVTQTCKTNSSSMKTTATDGYTLGKPRYISGRGSRKGITKYYTQLRSNTQLKLYSYTTLDGTWNVIKQSSVTFRSKPLFIQPVTAFTVTTWTNNGKVL